MITVDNLTHSFGNQLLFDDIRFTVNRKEHIGLVGKNGSGKTTLLKILSEKIVPNRGSISIPKHYSIGHVEQELRFTGQTVLEEGCRYLDNAHRDETWRVEKVLSGLGFMAKEIHLNPGSLSGGFQVRLSLAKVLIEEPDLMLLDEPTNYLDIVSIRWLERYMKRWQKEFILVTHDRGFMDEVVTHTMALHRKKIRKMSGNTQKLYLQIAQEEEIYEKTRINDEKRRKEVEVFINRFRAKARLAGLVQSRIKALEKKGSTQRLEKIENLEFSFNEAEFPAKYLMEIRDLAFSYAATDNPLIRNLSFTIESHDRIGVIGKNGRGKSTLLKLLAGCLKSTSGEIRSHQKVSVGYFGQLAVEDLHPNKTVEQEIAGADGGAGRQQVLTTCGLMMFSGDASQKKIQVLSGGEKSRVLLGKILLTPCNLLLLDEPTNHLDMESCDALMAAIDNFSGAVVIVTHNELFLRTLINRLIVFDEGTLHMFEGTYRDFLETVGWMDEKAAEANEKTRLSAITGRQGGEQHPTSDKRGLRKQRAEIIRKRSKALRPIEQAIRETEGTIESLERKVHRNNEEMIQLSASGIGNKIGDLSAENHTLRKEIEQLYSRLDDLLQSHDRIALEYDKRLDNLS